MRDALHRTAARFCSRRRMREDRDQNGASEQDANGDRGETHCGTTGGRIRAGSVGRACLQAGGDRPQRQHGNHAHSVEPLWRRRGHRARDVSVAWMRAHMRQGEDLLGRGDGDIEESRSVPRTDCIQVDGARGPWIQDARSHLGSDSPHTQSLQGVIQPPPPPMRISRRQRFGRSADRPTP
jgi:hypothetical protein